MSVQSIKSVNFATSGLTTVGYQLLNPDKTVKQARTITGVSEIGITGIYCCQITFDDAWAGVILWDTGEASPTYAIEDYSAIISMGGSGGGYVVVADQIWSLKEKQDLIDKIDKILNILQKVKIVQEGLKEASLKIAYGIQGIDKISKDIKTLTEKQNFAGLSKGIDTIEKDIENSLKTELITRNSQHKKIISLFEGIKGHIAEIKPNLDLSQTHQLINDLRESLGKISEDLDLSLRVCLTLVNDEDLETLLKEAGINVERIPYKRGGKKNKK